VVCLCHVLSVYGGGQDADKAGSHLLGVDEMPSRFQRLFAAGHKKLVPTMPARD
jgi:hypothetical protein